MTAQRSFKRIVRARMEKTGESYTAARAALLTADEPPVLASSDARIRERTGRGGEQWFDLLDGWGAATWKHREIAKRIAAELAIEPLAWNAQAIALSYERARGLRAPGEHEDGFAVTVSRTVGAPVERLYGAFVDPAERAAWLPGAELRERTATAPRRARFDWGDDGSRVQVAFDPKDGGRGVASLQHRRLPDAAAAERMKAYWRERLEALKEQLER